MGEEVILSPDLIYLFLNSSDRIVHTKYVSLRHKKSCSASFLDTESIPFFKILVFCGFHFKYCHTFQLSSDSIQNITKTSTLLLCRDNFLLLLGSYHLYEYIYYIDHRLDLPVLRYHEIMVIYPYPFFVVITQFLSCIIFINDCICILTGSTA